MSGFAPRPQRRLPTLTEVHTEQARRHLAAFIRQAWHVLEPHTPLVWGWHLDAISEHLEAVTRREIRDLVINVPPRCMKSLSVAVFWPAWVWIQDPGEQWLFSSYAGELSTRDSVKCRRLIESSWYQERWGDSFRLTGDQNRKTRYENDQGGYRIATSVGGATTGEGGTIIAVDDPHNVRKAESKKDRDGVKSWWKEVMSTRGNNPIQTGRVITMQRVHDADLVGQVLKEGGWEHLCLPMEFEPKRKCVTVLGWEDPRSKPGDLLWHQRFPRVEVDKLKRRLGSRGTASQLQQRPSPAEGSILKKHWWRFHRFTDIPPLDLLIQSWDMTFKDTDGSDYVVGQVWGKASANAYLLYQVRERLEFTATIRAVKAVTARYPKAVLKLVEDKANGPAVISQLKSKIPGLVARNPQGDKTSRYHAVTPVIESGNVYLPDPDLEGFEWVNGFIDECAGAPAEGSGSSEYDDQADAMEQAIDRLLMGTHSIVPKSRRRRASRRRSAAA